MNLWLRITVFVSKLSMVVMRRLNMGGTALPGLIAERMYPGILKTITGQMQHGVYLVTGTNGKTTTTKIVRSLLESRGLRVLTNRSGSNFTRGIIGSVIEHASWNGQLDYDIALFEIDEAYARYVARDVKPRAILVLNVMRDQLDRYGEIDTTAALIAEAMTHSGGAVLNADDPPVYKMRLALSDDKKTTLYGVSSGLQGSLSVDERLHDNKKLSTKTVPKWQVVLQEWNDATREMTVAIGAKQHTGTLTFDGIHNAQNATAALALVQHIFGDTQAADVSALASVTPAFGRGETVTIHGTTTQIALIKNPGGFNQNVRAFSKDSVGCVLILINDRYADSRDVSWLWDVDLSPFESLPALFVTGGIRAHDMSLRLQYQDIAVVGTETSIRAALRTAVDATPYGKDLLILPTYTAMLEVRKLVSKQTELEKIWQ